MMVIQRMGIGQEDMMRRQKGQTLFFTCSDTSPRLHMLRTCCSNSFTARVQVVAESLAIGSAVARSEQDYCLTGLQLLIQLQGTQLPPAFDV